MKNLWKELRRRGWYESLAAFVLCGGVTALLCLLLAGTRGLVSSLLALAAYALPSALLIVGVMQVTRRHPQAGALLLQVGLVFRTMAAIGLMLLVVLYYKNLHWAAFGFTLFVAASAPMAGQLFLKR